MYLFILEKPSLMSVDVSYHPSFSNPKSTNANPAQLPILITATLGKTSSELLCAITFSKCRSTKMSSERSERSKMSGALSALSGGEACGARWTLGALLLAPLAAANSSYCAVPAVMLLAIFITIASKSFFNYK